MATVNFSNAQSNGYAFRSAGNALQQYLDKKEKELKEEEKKKELEEKEEKKHQRDLNEKVALYNYQNYQSNKASPLSQYLEAKEQQLSAPEGTLAAGRQAGKTATPTQAAITEPVTYESYLYGDVYNVPKVNEYDKLKKELELEFKRAQIQAQKALAENRKQAINKTVKDSNSNIQFALKQLSSKVDLYGRELTPETQRHVEKYLIDNANILEAYGAYPETVKDIKQRFSLNQPTVVPMQDEYTLEDIEKYYGVT